MDYLEDKKLLELRFSNGMMILPFVRYKLLCSKNQDNTSSSSRNPVSKPTIFFRLFSNLIRIRVKKKKLVFFSSTLFNVKGFIIIQWMVTIMIYFLRIVY